ncbi:MAG TPA: ABC transporter substrate-binding protein [Chloroflexota bacterium]
MRTCLLALIILAISACAPASPSSSATSAPSAGVSQADRTLIAAVRVEPNSLAERPVLQSAAFAGFALLKRLPNAELTILDDKLIRHPYLAEAQPQLDSDTWRVFPDGQMETTWKLKPGIVWQDGTTFSAEDFVFAWRIYGAPEFAAASSRLARSVTNVTAPDDRTLIIRYGKLYPPADDLTGTDGFAPLPRQILEVPLQQSDPNTFAALPYWTREYIGLGPYRLTRWEPGSFIEAAAFDRHVLGAPKIGRVKVMFVADGSTAMSYILAGEVHLLGDTAIVLEQAATLKDEWSRTGGGFLQYRASQWRFASFQLRPELVSPRAILDLRVRKALAHSIDKQAINDSIYRGAMMPSDFIVSPLGQWGPAVQDAVVKYPFDLRRSEQLMNEAGFNKGTDGAFTSPVEGRFTAELKTTVDRADEMAVMASEWRKAGFAIQDAVLPAALSTDPESRATFPAIFASITPQGAVESFTTSQIPRAENQWKGGANRGAWSNPEYDRLADAFSTTLDPKERSAQIAQMAKIFTEDVAMIGLLFLAQPYAYVAALHGVLPVAPEGDITWNVPEWEFR